MKQFSKISGIAYILIFLSGFYANFAILEGLIDGNNASITTANFSSNQTQFRNGLFGFVIMLFFDIVLVWTLFGLTKPIGKKLTFLASFFRFLHVIFFSMALSRLWRIYGLNFQGNNTLELQSAVSKALSNFDTLWTIGLMFFGVHLCVLGYLAIKSTYIPKVIGILLLLAAIGYIVDGAAKLSLSSYAEYKHIFEVIVILPSVIGEFSFTVWLLIKGFNKNHFKMITP